MKESWLLFTVQKQGVKPTLIDSKDWLKQKAEAHNLTKQTSSKAKTEDDTNSEVKTKVASRNFATNTQTKGTQRPASTSATPPTPCCIVYKCNHRIWECRVFRKGSHSKNKGSGGSKTLILMFERKTKIQAMPKTQEMQEGRFQKFP